MPLGGIIHIFFLRRCSSCACNQMRSMVFVDQCMWNWEKNEKKKQYLKKRVPFRLLVYYNINKSNKIQINHTHMGSLLNIHITTAPPTHPVITPHTKTQSKYFWMLDCRPCWVLLLSSLLLIMSACILMSCAYFCMWKWQVSILINRDAVSYNTSILPYNQKTVNKIKNYQVIFLSA